MSSYYAATVHIHYYGQIPKKVSHSNGGVWAADFKSNVFGKNALGTDWRSGLEIAQSKPVDLSHKKETAHEALANMRLDQASLFAFTRSWGLLEGDVDEGRVNIRIDHVKPLQELLHRAWKADSLALEEMAKDVKARIDVSESGIDIAVLDLWSLVCMLFLRDHHAKRTKICRNPDCDFPYFLQQRRGQQYCTHKCAVLMNVRRFRQRVAKVKSQAQRRAKR